MPNAAHVAVARAAQGAGPGVVVDKLVARAAAEFEAWTAWGERLGLPVIP